MLNKIMVLFVSGLASINVNAAQLVQLKVDQQAETYNIYIEMDFDATAESVLEILTDYGNLGRLNDSIISSKVIETVNDETVRVQTRFESCVLFFCMEMQKVEDISEDQQGRILVDIVPDSSSFHSGQASWEVQSTKQGSRVIHSAKMVPDVWLPSWMGAAMVKDTLRQEIQKSFENLECLAQNQCQYLPEKALEPEEDWDDEAWDS